MMDNKSIEIQADIDALSRAAADALIQLCAERAGDIFIALAGGSTPKCLYQHLASPPYSELIPWQRLHLFFGDERSVDAENSESNYRMAKEALFDHVPIPSQQVYRIEGELPQSGDAAQRYAEQLSRALPTTPGGLPQFDLVLLGLGPDGHIASLFPDSNILHIRDKTVAAVWVDKFSTWRISLTFPVINAAQQIWLFVAGENKSAIVDQLFNHAQQTPRFPVEMLQPAGQLRWFMDCAASVKTLHSC